jgi:hypothetical protein
VLAYRFVQQTKRCVLQSLGEEACC